MKPMLAHKYQDHLSKLTYPLYVQPKLNGVRALYTNGRFQSRDQILWNLGVLSHLELALRPLSDRYIFDGELYKHGWSLQKINGAIAVKRTQPNDKTHDVGYHIYDFVDRDNPYQPFYQRTQALANLLSSLPIHIQPVKTALCHSQPDAEKFYSYCLSHNYEGMMYRLYNSPYGFESDCGNKQNRWPYLLKRKDWLDDWFIITDQRLGEGAFNQNVIGSLQCEMFNGRTFWVGSGLSDMERVALLDGSGIGKRVHVKFEMFSDDGSPLKPTIIEME